mmetsp:Transcript_16646/g.34169  ORF Transcript_16646/g.34169 Transcript_16646/m.34169 type:complete len:81 (+) Transcript_16646:3268-3510(+)
MSLKRTEHSFEQLGIPGAKSSGVPSARLKFHVHPPRDPPCLPTYGDTGIVRWGVELSSSSERDGPSQRQPDEVTKTVEMG